MILGLGAIPHDSENVGMEVWGLEPLHPPAPPRVDKAVKAE